MMQEKLKFVIPPAILAIAAIVVFVLLKLNTYYIDMGIPEEANLTVQYGEGYQEPVVHARYRGTFFHRRGTPVDVTVEGEVDDHQLGTYIVTYRAAYEGLTSVAKRIVTVEDTKPPEIILVSDPDHCTSPGTAYVEEGYRAIDNYDGDVTSRVIREEKDGEVIYTVADSFGNTATTTREIVYRDTVAPTIALFGSETETFEAGGDYTDPGYTATDDCDGDITANVKVDGYVDGHVPGVYTLTYYVEDSSKNPCEIKREVSVVDRTAPSLVINGDSSVYVQLGSAYFDQGVKAIDTQDGDLTDKVITSGKVNTQEKGVYPINYAVADSAGNISVVRRDVFVYEPQETIQTVNPGSKVVYLTFDDGPGQYTSKLLKILDKYNVKATFFVTNQYPEYRKLIKKEYKKGHTIAIHSYTHDYSCIYKSQEAFFEDLEQMQKICKSQTGKESRLIRFPGGSSNSISKKYCCGIMKDLSRSVQFMGYQYCDWNIASGDAGETTSTRQIINNVIAGMQTHDVSVVLQHDVKGYSVDAVEEIIAWGLANDYTFLPLDETSPMVHHEIIN